MTVDPAFHPTDADLTLALDLMKRLNGVAVSPPSDLPETGVGEHQALTDLAPWILGGAQALDAPTAFAHMDPPTPWVTWATTLWNASLNQNLLHPDVAPAAINIEKHVIGWLAPLFGMTGGHMTAGSTLANLTALWAAREIAGVRTLYASDAAHLSVGKAAHLLGLDFEALKSGGDGRLTTAAVPSDIDNAALVLTAGATSTGAIDDLSLCGAAAWVHVDAAWAGPLVLSDRHRSLLDGMAQANSVAVSAHKWMFQPKESGIILFKDVGAAHQAVSFGGAYLATPNVGVLGSRAANAAPLLATLLAWGRTGLAERIDHAMALATELHARLAGLPEVALFGPNISGVLLWRDRRHDSVDDLLALLPPGMASKTSVAGHDWIRQVAANPNADIDAIFAHITNALTTQA